VREGDLPEAEHGNEKEETLTQPLSPSLAKRRGDAQTPTQKALERENIKHDLLPQRELFLNKNLLTFIKILTDSLKMG